MSNNYSIKTYFYIVFNHLLQVASKTQLEEQVAKSQVWYKHLQIS